MLQHSQQEQQLARRRFGDPIPLIRSLSLSLSRDAYLNPRCEFQRGPSLSPSSFSLPEEPLLFLLLPLLLSFPLPELGFSALLFLFLLLLLAPETATRITAFRRVVEVGEEVFLESELSFITVESI